MTGAFLAVDRAGHCDHARVGRAFGESVGGTIRFLLGCRHYLRVVVLTWRRNHSWRRYAILTFHVEHPLLLPFVSWNAARRVCFSVSIVMVVVCQSDVNATHCLTPVSKNNGCLFIICEVLLILEIFWNSDSLRLLFLIRIGKVAYFFAWSKTFSCSRTS